MAALPTPQMPPKPRSRSSSPTTSRYVTRAPSSLAVSRASDRKCVVVISAGGVSTRRAAKRTASAAAVSGSSGSAEASSSRPTVTSDSASGSSALRDLEL